MALCEQMREERVCGEYLKDMVYIWGTAIGWLMVKRVRNWDFSSLMGSDDIASVGLLAWSVRTGFDYLIRTDESL